MPLEYMVTLKDNSGDVFTITLIEDSTLLRISSTQVFDIELTRDDAQDLSCLLSRFFQTGEIVK